MYFHQQLQNSATFPRDWRQIFGRRSGVETQQQRIRKRVAKIWKWTQKRPETRGNYSMNFFRWGPHHEVVPVDMFPHCPGIKQFGGIYYKFLTFSHLGKISFIWVWCCNSLVISYGHLLTIDPNLKIPIHLPLWVFEATSHSLLNCWGVDAWCRSPGRRRQ